MPTRDQALHLDMCSDWGLNSQPFSLRDNECPNQLSHTGQGCIYVFKKNISLHNHNAAFAVIKWTVISSYSMHIQISCGPISLLQLISLSNNAFQGCTSNFIIMCFKFLLIQNSFSWASHPFIFWDTEKEIILVKCPISKIAIGTHFCWF